MEEVKKIVKDGFSVLSFSLTEYQMEQFYLYLKLLLNWQRSISLTSVKEPLKILEQHFIDSLFCLTGAEFEGALRVVDVGTGAGFPGVPIKVCKPSIHLHLVESKKKKVNFLLELIQLLHLEDTRVLHGRAEDFARDTLYREEYDVALCRAVNVQTALELTIPFLKKGGRLLLLASEKIGGFEQRLLELGAELLEKRSYTLPFSKKSRSLLVVEKRYKTPQRFPRPAHILAKRR